MMKYLIIGLVIASLVGALTFSGNYILKQNTEIAELRLSVKAEQEARKKSQALYEQEKKDRIQLSKKNNELEEERNDLAELLARHDLERLAKAKPESLERIFNEGLKKELEDFRKFGRTTTD